MRLSFFRFVGLAGMMGGCSSDHGMSKVVDPEPPLTPRVELRVDLAYQENDWGRQMGRCQMQVAFEPLPEFVEPEDSLDGDTETEAPVEPAPLVQEPEAPGDCVFSEVPPMGEPLAPDTDNWQLSGEVVGPDSISLMGDATTFVLEAEETPHGGVRYEWLECGVEAYPFAQTLTLDVPSSDKVDALDAFTLDDLVPVGPRIWIESPDDSGGIPVMSTTEALALRWTLSGSVPEVDTSTTRSQVRIRIQSQDREQEDNTRWVVCWPDEDGWMDIPAESLAELVAGRNDESRYSTHLDIHAELFENDHETPWGEALSIRTNISSGIPIQPLGEMDE